MVGPPLARRVKQVGGSDHNGLAG